MAQARRKKSVTNLTFADPKARKAVTNLGQFKRLVNEVLDGMDVTVSVLRPGISGASVFLAHAVAPSGVSHKPAVLKIATVEQLLQEEDRYNKRVFGVLEEALFPQLRSGDLNKRPNDPGILMYAEAGRHALGSRLRELIEQDCVGQARGILSSLFTTLRECWYQRNASTRTARLSSADAFSFSSTRGTIARFEARCDDLNKRGWEPSLEIGSVTDFWPAKSGQLTPMQTPFCLCHGDLNPDNVRVDGNEPVLIDFYETRFRHFFWDFVTLEAHLVSHALAPLDGENKQKHADYASWIRRLYRGEAVPLTREADPISAVQSIVETIRSHAKAAVYSTGRHDISEWIPHYYFGVLRQMVRFAERDDNGRSDRQRWYAAHAAIELARAMRIKNGEVELVREDPHKDYWQRFPAADHEVTDEGSVVSGAVLCGRLIPESPDNLQLAQSRLRHCLEESLAKIGEESWVDFSGASFVLFLEQRGAPAEEVLGALFDVGIDLQRKAGPDCTVALCVDWETSARRVSVRRRRFFVGPRLDDSRRVCALADEGQILVSDAAIGDLGHHLRSFVPHLYIDHCVLHDTDKRKHVVNNVYALINGDPVIGSASAPEAVVRIEYRGRRRADSDQVFVERLVDNDDVTIAGLTHEGTAEYLVKALELRRAKKLDFWSNLVVIFPTEESLRRLIEMARTDDERVQQMLGGRTQILSFLRAQGYPDRWEVIEYGGHFSFIGDRFNPPGSDGTIRYAPVLIGENLRDTFYIEPLSRDAGLRRVRPRIHSHVAGGKKNRRMVSIRKRE